RLDRKASSRQHQAVFARFEVVHVRTVAVDLLPDAMPRAVNELLAVARLFDHRSRRLIDLPAGERAASGDSLFHSGNGCVSSRGDDLKYPLVLFGHLLADIADSREIAIN